MMNTRRLNRKDNTKGDSNIQSKPHIKSKSQYPSKINDLKKRYGKMSDDREMINFKNLNLTNKRLVKNKSFVIIIPYRDDDKHVRKKHLETFITKIPKLFNNFSNDFNILIVEQYNKKNRFNRGVLLNIGFEICKDSFDYFIFHDIDLIPDNDLIPYYTIYPFRPIHLARLHTKYSVGGKYFGGVNSFNKKDFIKINGYPNNYWGWGGEDDELYDRVVDAKLDVYVPKKGKYNELKHNNPTTQQKLPFNQKMRLRLQHSDWRKNGLNNLKYEVVNIKKLKKNISIISVKF
jgi:hypothetical protein